MDVLHRAADMLEDRKQPEVPEDTQKLRAIENAYETQNLREALQFLSDEFPERTEEELTAVVRSIDGWEDLCDSGLLFAVEDAFTERDRKAVE